MLDLGNAVTGEARDAAHADAALGLQAKAAGRALAIISGGELAVSLRDVEGGGGRWQALAADTDGIDGGKGKPIDAAGTAIDATTLARVRHLDAKNFLHNNDATSFFEAAGGLIVRGPTHTYINDFRVIPVDA